MMRPRLSFGKLKDLGIRPGVDFVLEDTKANERARTSRFPTKSSSSGVTAFEVLAWGDLPPSSCDSESPPTRPALRASIRTTLWAAILRGAFF